MSERGAKGAKRRFLTPRGLPRMRSSVRRVRFVRRRFLEGELGGSFNSLDFGFHGVKEFGASGDELLTERDRLQKR